MPDCAGCLIAAVLPYCSPSLVAMRGLGNSIAAASFAVTWACFCAAAQERPQPAIPCGGDTIARGAVSRIVDGRTFVLDDGREIRLAAIEVPLLPLATEAEAAPEALRPGMRSSG